MKKYLDIELYRSEFNVKEVSDSFFSVLEKINETDRVSLNIIGNDNSPSSYEEIIPSLLDIGISADSIANAVSSVFSLKVFNFYRDRDYSKVIVGEDYILDCDGIIYFTNPFSDYIVELKNALELFKKDEVFVSGYGIISTSDFNKFKDVMSMNEKSFNPINSIPTYYDSMERLQDIFSMAIDKSADSISIIPNELGSDFFLFIDGKKVKSEIFISNLELKHLIEFLKQNYTNRDENVSFLWEFNDLKYKFVFSFESILVLGEPEEMVSIDLFNLNNSLVSPSSFGLTKDEQKEIFSSLNSPSGFALISGRKNVGKTTLLYALSNKIKDRLGKSIFLISDRLENDVNFISQIETSDVNGEIAKLNVNNSIIFAEYRGGNCPSYENVLSLMSKGNVVILVLEGDNLLLKTLDVFRKIGDKNYISNKFLFSLNINTFSKVCSDCYNTYRFLEAPEYRRYFDVVSSPKSRDLIRYANPCGCPSCNYGYSGYINLVESLFNSKRFKTTLNSDVGFDINFFFTELRGNGLEDPYEAAMGMVRNGDISISEMESSLGQRDIK